MAHRVTHTPPAKAGGKPTKADLTQVPIEHLDLEKVKNLADLLDGYAKISFQARTLGRCAQVLERMMLDPQATVFFGGAGALVPGGLKKVLRDLVELGLVDVMVTTGAIAYHDFYEAHGYRHYMSSPDADDILLREHMLDRVYDTLADEDLFRECDDEIANMADNLEPRAYSSREFLALMGERAAKDPNSLVGACSRRGIPYFVPALNDSSIGIALTRHHRDRVKAKKPMIAIDSIKDNYEMAQVKLKSPRSGVFYVGGGTPKNYISQVEVIQEVLGYEENPHWYGVQITTDVPQWGGLSGCTFEESQSWGKFRKEAKMAQSLVEATIGLPLLVGYLLQKGVHKKRKPKTFTWKGDELVRLA
jgi:deoxyhypusine synthase